MYTYLTIAVLILMGILLIVAYSKIDADTVNLPSSSSVKRANQGLFTMGITFIVSAISFGICYRKCGSGLVTGSKTIAGFFFLLGIVMTALAGTIVGSVHGSAKSWAVFILVTGILFIVAVGGMFAYANKHMIPGMAMNFNYY